MANKYNSVMDHITMSEEMQKRILQNVENEVKSAPKARIDKSLSIRNAKITRIIGIVAAAGIVLTIGGLVLAKIAFSQSSSTNKSMQADIQFTAGGAINDIESDELDRGTDHEAPAASAETTVAGVDSSENYYIAGVTDNKGERMTPHSHFLSLKKAEFVDGDVRYVVTDASDLLAIRSIIFKFSFALASTNEEPDGSVFVFENSEESFSVKIDSKHIRIGTVNYSYKSSSNNGSLDELLKEYIMEHGVKVS